MQPERPALRQSRPDAVTPQASGRVEQDEEQPPWELFIEQSSNLSHKQMTNPAGESCRRVSYERTIYTLDVALTVHLGQDCPFQLRTKSRGLPP